MRGLTMAVAGGMLAAPAWGAALAETITYTYDAQGRIKTVVHSGGANNGVTTTYTHDQADNRKRVTTAGASH